MTHLQPQCPKHGPMALVRPSTREQEFCGTWHKCTHVHPRCRNAVLLPSPGLRAQLAAQAEAADAARLAETHAKQGDAR